MPHSLFQFSIRWVFTVTAIVGIALAALSAEPGWISGGVIQLILLAMPGLDVFLMGGPLAEKFVKKNPVISRTIQIRGDQTLEDLHHAIFAAFGRWDEHMYEFQFGKGPMDPKAPRYVLPGAIGMEMGDTKPPAGRVDKTTLDSLGLEVNRSFGYWFDFGDDWWHQIDVTAIGNEMPKGKLPKVIKKVGQNPPQYADADEYVRPRGPGTGAAMRKLDFIGTVRSNQGEFSQQMVVPGRGDLVLAPADWPVQLSPGTLNIQIDDDGFPQGFDGIGQGDGLQRFDRGEFKPEFAIPPWRITGNTLQPTPDEPLRGSAQMWLAELEVISTGQMATCWTLRRLGSTITTQIELVAEENLRSRLNLCDGTEVKVTVWKGATKRRLPSPDEMIAEWGEAARNVEDDFGEEKAMGYLIGEKFLHFLEATENNAQWRDAIPAFVTEIRSVFEAWKIAEFLNTPRRLGALGHTSDDLGHRMLRASMEESERLEEDARYLMLLEWAKELLLDEGEP